LIWGLILDGDPREDFNKLLDTANHTRFAVNDGVVVRDRLFRAVDPETKTRKPRSGWFAYNPPLVALPGSYRDLTKWNRWEGKAVSGMFSGVVALDYQRWLNQNEASEEQVGDLNAFDGGEIRAFELGFVGTFNFAKPWIYTIFAASNGFAKGFDTTVDTDWTVRDLRVDIPIHGDISLAVGKQKEPISLERITSLLRLPWQERSAAADSLMTSRNVGLTLNGTVFNRRMTWAGGVFNDWLNDEGSFSENSKQAVGRLTWLPFVSEDDHTILHFGAGVRFDDAEEGVRYLTEPEFNKSPVFVDTGLFQADSTTTTDLEAYVRTGPFWIGGEYVHTSVEAPGLDDPTFTGYHVSASWVFSGEMRKYNRRAGLFMPVIPARTVYQDGWGAWEAAIRWSTVDLTDGSVKGGEMDVLSLGLTWWLTPSFNVSANYRSISLDRFDLVGRSDGFNLRLVLMLD
jgi:phosphate-selective porin OprO/OprP